MTPKTTTKTVKPDIPQTPTDRDLLKLVGSKKPLLKDLITFLRKTYEPEETLRYTKKDGTWTVFYRRGGKSLTYISFREGGFTVTVVIGATLADEVKSAAVSKKTEKMFKEARQYHDGRWLIFNVKNKTQVEDIKKLLLMKKRPVKKSMAK